MVDCAGKNDKTIKQTFLLEFAEGMLNNNTADWKSIDYKYTFCKLLINAFHSFYFIHLNWM